jgi:hypothetical protein
VVSILEVSAKYLVKEKGEKMLAIFLNQIK